MKRDKTVDCLKGYACILVAFGHVILGVRNGGNVKTPFFSDELESFIWSFHVALFMFLSGYVYQLTGGCAGKRSRLEFIKHKLLNLGVPYFVFSAVYIVINSVIPGVNNANKLSDILFIWKDPVAQYWFLYTLFVLFLLWTVLSLFLKNWQITVLLVILYYVCNFADIRIPFLDQGLGYAFSFGLGTCLNSLVADKWKKAAKIITIALHVSVVSVFIYTGFTNKNFFDDAEEFIGICASIAFISMLIKLAAAEKALLFINKYSFPIYLLHTIFTAGTRIVLIKLGIHNYEIHVIGALIIGIGMPVLVGMVTERIPVLDFFFYPSKNINKLKVPKIEA